MAIHEHILNMLIKERALLKKVVRNGKLTLKKFTNRKGYKIDPATGDEVRKLPAEVRKAQIIQKKAALKRKSKMKQTIAKRKRSLKKHTWKGTWGAA